MIRTSRLAVAATLGALVLSGCGSSQVHTGAAAVVGDSRITTTQLEQVVDRGLADPQAGQQLGADRATFQRQTLSRLVRRVVLDRAAADAGVTVAEGSVDNRLAQFAQQAGGQAQLEQQAAQSGIATPDLRGFVRDLVVEEALADKLTTSVVVPPAELQRLYTQNIAQYDQVHAAHILVKDPAQAAQILARVKADPTRFAALAAQFSIDTSNKDKGGDLGFAGRGQFVPAFENALFAAKPGSFFTVRTQFGSHVVHVLERRTTTLAQATPELRRLALQKPGQAAVEQALARAAAAMGVTVNPRFGRWDPTRTVVAAAAEGNGVSSPAPGPAAPAPAPGAPGGAPGPAPQGGGPAPQGGGPAPQSPPAG